MSGGITAATVATYATAAAAAYSVYTTATADKPKAPEMPKIEALKPGAQASKAPDAGALRQANANAVTGPGAGNGSTFLTGGSGLDPGSMLLGKSKLLGQ